MATDRMFKAWINPLQCLEVDEPWAASRNTPPTADQMLAFLSAPGMPSDIPSMVARYQEISVEETRLFAAPAEDRILEKLVWPLRHAKSSYTLGNFLGAISLCGMVAEMVAMLLFDIAEVRLNNRPMDERDQEALFGRSFEKLDQHRRVAVLRAYGAIDDETKKAFDLIRATRRKYLHLWSQDHGRLAQDAVTVFKAAVRLVVRVIGQDIQDGKIVLNAALTKYLERTGVYQPVESAEA
jgi:hypothetical protein